MGYPPVGGIGYPRALWEEEWAVGEEEERLLAGTSTYLDYYDLGDAAKAGGAHRMLAPKKKREPGVPYCEEICEMEPDKEIEIAEGFAMAAFTVDYLGRWFTVHAVPYRIINHKAYANDRAVRYRAFVLFRLLLSVLACVSVCSRMDHRSVGGRL